MAHDHPRPCAGGPTAGRRSPKPSVEVRLLPGVRVPGPRAGDPVRGPIPQDSGAGGSSPPADREPPFRLRGPADRAPASGAGGHGFESRRRHSGAGRHTPCPSRARDAYSRSRTHLSRCCQRSAFRPPMPAERVRIPSGAQGSTSSAVNGVEWHPGPSRGSRDAVMESGGTDIMTRSHGRRRRVTPSPAREGRRPIG